MTRVIDDDGTAIPLGDLFDIANKADRDAGNLSAGQIVDWKNVLGLAALAYLASIDTTQLVDDAVTFPKFQNLTGPGVVVGRKVGSTGAGNAEELAQSDVRALLGTLDADTVGGQSASAIATAAANDIRNGVGTAYDTLIEIYNQLVTDETAVSGILTSLSAKNKLGVAADLGTSSADAVHTHNLGTLDVHAQLYLKSDGSEVPCPFSRTSVNVVTYYLPVAPTTGQYRSVVVPAIA